MHWVKGIEAVLDHFVVRALLAIVHPDGDQGKAGKTLLYNINFPTENLYGERHSADHFPVDIKQADRLRHQTPPFFRAEQVKHQNHQYTVAKIIYKKRKTQQIGYGGNDYKT